MIGGLANHCHLSAFNFVTFELSCIFFLRKGPTTKEKNNQKNLTMNIVQRP